MGRTGVFITLSIVLERMRYEGVVDIFQTVKMLRTQRPAMVQTEVRNHTDQHKKHKLLVALGNLAWKLSFTVKRPAMSCLNLFVFRVRVYLGIGISIILSCDDIACHNKYCNVFTMKFSERLSSHCHRQLFKHTILFIF